MLTAAAAILLLGIITDPAATSEPVRATQDKESLARELPRIPPVEPDKALTTFTLQHGFRLQLVASEPLVADPVDACFDAGMNCSERRTRCGGEAAPPPPVLVAARGA